MVHIISILKNIWRSLSNGSGIIIINEKNGNYNIYDSTLNIKYYEQIQKFELEKNNENSE